MIYIPSYKLKSGMKLAADLNLKKFSDSEASLLKKGTVINEDNIEKFLAFRISGAYIEDGIKNRIIDEKLKKKSVSTISKVYEMCDKYHKIFHKEVINDVKHISVKLVDNIHKNNYAQVGISDLKAYDMDTYIHSLSVTIMSIAIGTALNLDKEELYNLGVCALLHDIGKVAVPIDIISKPSKLTKEEFEVVKKHPVIGCRFIEESNILNKEVCYGILGHHENYDGTGYPLGLKGAKIPLFSRIITVADVYDALTGVRPYRAPIKPMEAIEYIMGGVDTKFDYEVVKAFLRKIEPYPVGCHIVLSDKRKAVVIKRHKDFPLRPVVKTLEEKPQILDLQRNKNCMKIVILDKDYSYLSQN